MLPQWPNTLSTIVCEPITDPHYPNMAEAGKEKEPPGPLTPEQAAQQQAAQAANGGQGGEQKPGDTNITVNNNRAKEDGTGRDIQAALGSQQAAVQPR